MSIMSLWYAKECYALFTFLTLLSYLFSNYFPYYLFQTQSVRHIRSMVSSDREDVEQVCTSILQRAHDYHWRGHPSPPPFDDDYGVNRAGWEEPDVVAPTQHYEDYAHHYDQTFGAGSSQAACTSQAAPMDEDVEPTL